MTTLHIDLETYCDVDLRTRGLDVYSSDPSCEVLMMAYAFNEDAPKLWLPHLEKEMPARVRAALTDPAVVKKAWNCLPGETEVLTPSGWCALAELPPGVEVMQWEPKTERLSFVAPLAYVKSEAAELIEWNTQYHKGAYTSDHRVYFQTRDKPIWRPASAERVSEMHPNSTFVPVSGDYEPAAPIEMSEDEARLMEAIRADGSWDRILLSGPQGARFSLRKERKVARLKALAQRLGFTVSQHPGSGEGVHLYKLHGRLLPQVIVDLLKREKTYDLRVLQLSHACRRAILDEARYWDGSSTKTESTYTLCSSVQQNAEMFQLMAHLTGRAFNFAARPNTRGFSARTQNPLYNGTMRPRRRVKLVERAKWIKHNGPVYCVAVPTGAFLARRRGVVWVTGNCQFERTIIRRVLGVEIPPEQTRCAMVRAYMLALPGSLDDCGKVLRLGDDFQKSTEGKRLIRIFCVKHAPTKKFPQTRYDFQTHPTEWAQFCQYCLQDVVSERKIDNLLARFPVPEVEWKLYALDQKINDKGIHIDLPFVENAIEFMGRRKREIGTDLKRLTGLANPNSTSQLLPWVRERGYPFDSLGKERVVKALTDFEANMRQDCVRALRLRLTAAKTSVLKFRKITQLVGADGRLRFTLQMAGAGRTLRWAGRGVQVQNLPRCRKDYEPFLADIRRMVVEGDYESLVAFFGDPIDVLTSSVRTALSASPGKELRVADLNAIESRLSGWLSGCESLMKVFAEGRCPYKTFAALVLNIPYDQVTPAQRQVFKPAVLGCWYSLSGGGEVGKYPETIKTGLWAYAEAMGVKLTKEEAHRHVATFRETYHEAGETWAALERGMMEALTTRQPQKVGPVTFDVMPPFLRMQVPTGGYIYYLRPQIGDHLVKHPGGEFVKRGVSYEGKNKLGQWTRVNTHPGKVFENGVQRIARDILCCGMLEAHDQGFDLLMTSHDEIVTEQDILDEVHTVKALEEAMSVVPPWAPGLMLAAKGFSSPFYRKD